MIFGYARVSTTDQDNLAQITALEEAGCERIFSEKKSGKSRWDRPQLNRMIDQLRPGDTVMVWNLDRFTRSLADLIFLLDEISKAGAFFRSLREGIDTSGPAGQVMVHMLGVFAEYERNLIVARTKAGLAEARAQGRVPGRKPALTKEQQAEIFEAVNSGRKSQSAMARLYGVHPATISRLIISHGRVK